MRQPARVLPAVTRPYPEAALQIARCLLEVEHAVDEMVEHGAAMIADGARHIYQSRSGHVYLEWHHEQTKVFL